MDSGSNHKRDRSPSTDLLHFQTNKRGKTSDVSDAEVNASQIDNRLLEIYNAQKTNRYDNLGTNLGNLHISEIGLRIFKANVTVSHLAKSGSKKYSLTFDTFEEANSFVDSKVTDINPDWKAYIRSEGLYLTGIIFDVGTMVSDEDIISGLDPISKKLVIRVERLKTTIRSEEGVLTTNSTKVKIYCKSKLPRFIVMFGIFHKVHYFIPPILRCFNCQRFGHGSNFCTNSTRCSNCSEHHTNQNCSSNPKCVNCKGPHISADRKCPHFDFQRDIHAYMSLYKMSKQKATFIVQMKFKKSLDAAMESNHSSCGLFLDENNPYLDKRDLFELQYSEKKGNAEFFNSTMGDFTHEEQPEGVARGDSSLAIKKYVQNVATHQGCPLDLS